jgi:hypothetical protein
MAMAGVKATKADQKERMVAITASRQQRRAAISAVRSAQADFEVAFSKRVEGILACIDLRLLSSSADAELVSVAQQDTTDEYAGRSHEAWAPDKSGGSRRPRMPWRQQKCSDLRG